MAAGLLSGLLTTVGLMAPTAPVQKDEPDRHPTRESAQRLCHGYQSCREDGFTDAGYKRHRYRSFWKMYGGSNCTNFVAYKLVRSGMPNHRPRTDHGRRPAHLNAYRWGIVYRSITDHRPSAGAVAWWEHRGRDGHVAYVERVNRDGSLMVSEDSWSGNGFDWRRVYRGSSWPTGFIHFSHRGPEGHQPGHETDGSKLLPPLPLHLLDLQDGTLTLDSGPAQAAATVPPAATTDPGARLTPR